MSLSATIRTHRGSRTGTKVQRSWYFYDWAISSYQTTTASLMLEPYLRSVAERAACPTGPERCTETLSIAGISVQPAVLPGLLATIATLASSVLVLFVGSWADRSERPVRLLGGYALAGAGASSGMYFVAGTAWQLGAVLLILASLAAGCSLVVYDSLLARISAPPERDQVSCRGWAFGFAGGSSLLAVHLVIYVAGPGYLGISTDLAVRICLLTAGLWWGVFAVVAVRGLRSLSGSVMTGVDRAQSAWSQLHQTMKELREYPQTARFLVAYLFYNDGVQTVIYSFAAFGTSELLLDKGYLAMCLVLAQVVGVGGTLWFGSLATRHGASVVVRLTLVVWLVPLAGAYFCPAGNLWVYALLAMLVGLILGGTQALSRSLYCQLIPRGREAQFFGLYQALERGTSWYGIFLFGVVYAITSSYRSALLSTAGFFVIGAIVMRRVHFADGVRAAGNVPPPAI